MEYNQDRNQLLMKPNSARQELARNATGENSFNPNHVVLQEISYSGTSWEFNGTPHNAKDTPKK